MKLQRFLKHRIDFFGSLVCIIIFSPLFLIVTILIKVDSKGPVFLRQERVGKEGKVFKIWKFRTMIKGAESMGLGIELTKDDPRITRVGKILRRFGIDELPQVINIALGEMSFVGPRPSLPCQVTKYSEFEKKRLTMKPGITNINITRGWNILPWEERIKWDIWYIENWSLWLDFKILIKTLFIVLNGRGQYGVKNSERL